MLPGRTFTPEDVVKILIQRRWLILVPFAVGLALVPVIAKNVPKVYRSETLIMVVPQRVPDSYVKSTITGTVEDRLFSISDQILSRSRLERIITDFDLYKDQRAKAPMEDVVQLMRTDIGSPQIKEKEQSFRVSYQNRDASVAQKVTARLASLFIEENTNERENLAQSTNVFLESQLQDAKQRLIEHEQKLETYRRSHAGELPSQLEGNLRAIQSAQLLLQSANESINRSSERRLLVERQLVDARTLPIPVPNLPVAGGQSQEVRLSAAQQLEAAQARLEVYRQRYKPEHPDVRLLERTIGELQLKAEEEAKRPAEVSPAKAPSRDEVDRQKRIRELESEIEVIDRQLTATRAEEVQLRSTIAEYQRKVEAVPTRESDLVELTRDYDVLKKAYDSLLARWEDSKVATNLERRQIGEQFRILDAASLPEQPANQVKRLGIIFGGAAAGLILGLAIVGILELRDSSLNREEDLARVIAVPVLALVPLMAAAEERRRKRLWRLVVDVAASAVVVASAAVVVIWGLAQR